MGKLRMGESEQWAEWLRGGSPWKGPLLALLLDQPGHSYELASRLTRRVGSAWKLDDNDASRVLKRAEELGLATSKWADSKYSRRPVQVFEPTSLTGPAVEYWMSSPVVDDPYRFEMWTRMVVSGPEHADALLAALGVCERRVFGLLREYGKPFPTETWAGLELELAREGVTMRLQADLQWIERARKKILEFKGQHGAA
jgi:DNA-binding PadR family transcriptional regulator